jgi:peptidoglycan/xylan/chitin deacetylase (PgdA/CDA1 family)
MSSIGFLPRFIARSPSGFVLAFHEIAPSRVVEMVESLRPAEVVHLGDLIQRQRDSKPTSGLFAITVDDGVGDNVRSLARLFLNREWPATFYIPTGYLDTGVGMVFQWWRRLHPLLPRTRLELSSGPLDLSAPGAVARLSQKMETLWYTQRLDTYQQLTMELAEIASRPWGMEAIQPAAPISWAEVENLSKSDLIRFESHGVSHAAMSSLSEEELAFEMKHSRDVIAEHTARPCRHLAYPFGGPQSIGLRAPAVAQRFYDSAATMTPGHVANANPWLLPRIPLYPENSTRFAQLKVFLKCGAIRPPKFIPALSSVAAGLRPAPPHPDSRAQL